MKVIYRLKVGEKDVDLEQLETGSWVALCWCSVTKMRVGVPLTAAQVVELCNGRVERCIDKILPDTPAPLREIFLTGLTPAEFTKFCGEEYDEEEEVQET